MYNKVTDIAFQFYFSTGNTSISYDLQNTIPYVSKVVL